MSIISNKKFYFQWAESHCGQGSNIKRQLLKSSRLLKCYLVLGYLGIMYMEVEEQRVVNMEASQNNI